jgi:RNA polymerase sigma-70 factor (ECF subfamily)
LKGEHKEVIMLVFFQGKSYQEVADELGLPLGTVKAKVYRAKEMLREGLTKEKVLAA